MGALGLVLALLAAASFGVGLSLQKRRAVALPGLVRSPIAFALAFFSDLRWLGASALVVAGWGFEFAALSRAPVALVLPTALSGIVLVAALSSRWFGERLARREWAGVAACVAGVVAAAIPATDGNPVVSARFDPTALACAVGFLIVLAIAALALGRRGRAVSFCLSFGAGFLYAASGSLTKALAVAASGPRSPAVILALVAPLVVVSVAAVLVLQAAFQRGSATIAVAVSGAVSSFLPATLGGAVFGESWPEGAAGAMRLGALAAMLAGFGLLIRPTVRLQAPAPSDAHRGS